MEIEAGTVETAEATCIRCGEVRPCVTWPVQRLSADSEPVEETVCMTCVMPVTPEEFAMLRNQALSLGFRHVESGPLVRSSYHADEAIRG